MKKTISILLVTLLLCTSMVACNAGDALKPSNGTSDSDSNATTHKNPEVTTGITTDDSTDDTQGNIPEVSDGSVGLGISLNDDEQSYYIDWIGSCKDSNLLIPSTYNGKPVTRIADNAFKNCYQIKSVTIPDSVKSIGSYAFDGCINLESIQLGSGVQEIGKHAFSICTNLKRIETDSKNKNYSSVDGNLYNKDKTTLIRYASGKDATDFIIPAGVVRIEENAFNNSFNLMYLKLSDTVTSIGESAFYHCYNLVSVVLSSGLKTIEDDAFDGCKRLMEVINHSNLNVSVDDVSEFGSVAGGALEVHSGESKIISVDDYLFYTVNDEHYLISYVGKDVIISLPDSYNGNDYVINNSAFYNRTNLISVTIPESVKDIKSNAFGSCYKLVEIIDHSRDDGGAFSDYALEFHKGDSKLIKQGQFYFYTVDGINYLVDYFGTDSNVTLPDSVNGEKYRIKPYTFMDNETITSITISKNVTNIGDHAFQNCKKLSTVQIENGVTDIGSETFSGCASLKNISIPSSVVTIGKRVVMYCSSLLDITFDGTESQWTTMVNSSQLAGLYHNYVVHCTDGDIKS